MISKCANPACSESFRYLHDGKIFLFECGDDRGMNASADDGEFVGGPRLLRCFWLCGACCRTMTLIPEGKGVKAVPAQNPDCSRKLAA